MRGGASGGGGARDDVVRLLFDHKGTWLFSLPSIALLSRPLCGTASRTGKCSEGRLSFLFLPLPPTVKSSLSAPGAERRSQLRHAALVLRDATRENGQEEEAEGKACKRLEKTE